MTEQFTRAGYTFTPTLDPETREPGPIHVARDGHVFTTVQPDFLEGRDDDTELAAFLDHLHATITARQIPGPRQAAT